MPLKKRKGNGYDNENTQCPCFHPVERKCPWFHRVELKCPWFHRVELNLVHPCEPWSSRCPWFHRVELNLVHPCEPWSSRCPWFHRVELLLIFLAGGRAGSPPRQKANKVGRMVVKVAKTD